MKQTISYNRLLNGKLVILWVVSFLKTKYCFTTRTEEDFTRYPCDVLYPGCFFIFLFIFFPQKSRLALSHRLCLYFQYRFYQSELWLRQPKLLPVVVSLRHFSNDQRLCFNITFVDFEQVLVYRYINNVNWLNKYSTIESLFESSVSVTKINFTVHYLQNIICH